MAARAPARQVVLLRGINVGGKNKLPMAQLRQICTTLGCERVTTYIQSGNVVLDSPLAPRTLAQRLESAVGDFVGFAPRIVVRRPADLSRVLAANPFPGTEGRFLHVGFMSEQPTAEAVAALGTQDCSPEGFQLAGAEIFFNFVEGVGRSRRLAKVPFERILGVAITSRNLRTVQKLAELADIDRSTPNS